MQSFLLLRFVCALAVFGQSAAQDDRMKNPVAGDAAAIKEGASLFRGNCSPCHGFNARGGGCGPDLTTRAWIHGGRDAELFRTISQGVSGTEMPANAFEDSEIWALIASFGWRGLGHAFARQQAGARTAFLRQARLFTMPYGQGPQRLSMHARERTCGTSS
jgi:Cytochrome C oxidase, cbb3-type, subunit III